MDFLDEYFVEVDDQLTSRVVTLNSAAHVMDISLHI